MSPYLKEGARPTSVDVMNSVCAINQGYLKLPIDVEVSYICRDFEEMENCLRLLLDDVKSQLETAGVATVGLDCEWDIDYSASVDSCRVDVIQIAFGKKVYVLHIDRCWSSLPTSLVSLLENEFLKKVGRQVFGELSRISRGMQVDCRSKLELGSFCSSRKVIPNGSSSLSSITLRVLGKNIKKDERQSRWSNIPLSPEQINYVALDAWASLAIYESVRNTPDAGSRITSRNYVPGLFVSLKPRGSKQVIAS